MKTAQVIRRIAFHEWGGTENVVWNLARRLNRVGVPTEILATGALGGPAAEDAGGAPIRRFPYRYPYFPLSREKRLALDKKGGNPWSPALFRYLAAGRFDLIHCHNLGRLAESSARIAARQRIPLVLSLHGGYFEVPQEEREELLRPLHRTVAYGGALERLFRRRRDALEQAAGIICVGENELDGLRRRFPDKLVRHLPNGVDPARFDVAPAFDWRQELGLAPDTRLLLNVSRLDYQKNQMLLLKLMAVLRERHDEVHLLLIGPPTAAWYYEKLKSSIATLHLEDVVSIVPGLPSEDERLTAAYLQADRFILPSKHEPFGIVVLEAWCAGCPVIAADTGGLGRLVRDGENGVKFASDNLDSLLEAYRRSPDRGSEICRRAGEEVRRKYDWNMIAAELRDFYTELSHG